MESVFIHPTAIVDEGCEIGEGTKIWHFSHIMTDCIIGEQCNIGQNVVISPLVVLGNNVKVQNNVSIYTGVTCADDVFLGPSMVFTNVTNPRSAINRKGNTKKPMLAEVQVSGQMPRLFAEITLVNSHLLGPVPS
jgi:UDP-2-acetamido-3-amino-2,3-dideoxy-glucuronate N-acetyltransferase